MIKSGLRNFSSSNYYYSLQTLKQNKSLSSVPNAPTYSKSQRIQSRPTLVGNTLNIYYINLYQTLVITNIAIINLSEITITIIELWLLFILVFH